MNIATQLKLELRSKDLYVRRSAAESAGRYLCLAWPAAPALICALDDEDKFVRRFSALSLGKLAPGATAAVPRLTELVNDPDDVLNEACCWALGRIGPAARAALPALHQAARRKLPHDPKDPTKDYYVQLVRDAAATAIRRIKA